MSEKTFTTWLVLNYKTGMFRAYKRKPTMMSNEIPIQVSLKVIIPEQPQMKATGQITLNETKVSDMFIESL